jgi:hypothetical protein
MATFCRPPVAVSKQQRSGSSSRHFHFGFGVRQQTGVRTLLRVILIAIVAVVVSPASTAR